MSSCTTTTSGCSIGLRKKHREPFGKDSDEGVSGELNTGGKWEKSGLMKSAPKLHLSGVVLKNEPRSHRKFKHDGE